MIKYQVLLKVKETDEIHKELKLVDKMKEAKIIKKDLIERDTFSTKYFYVDIEKVEIKGKRGKREQYQEPAELIEKHCYSWNQFKQEVNKLPIEYKDSFILFNEQIKRMANIRQGHMQNGFNGRFNKGKRLGYGGMFKKAVYKGYMRRKGMNDIIKWHTTIDQASWDNNLLKYIRTVINGDDVDFFRSKLHLYTKLSEFNYNG